MFVTFLYRIGEEKERYFGKIVWANMSDDHNGLDEEVRPYLLCGLNTYRESKGLPLLTYDGVAISTLSYSFEDRIPVYSTINDNMCFDFYMIVRNYSSCSKVETTTIVDGNNITMDKKHWCYDKYDDDDTADEEPNYVSDASDGNDNGDGEENA
jgi:hypothetical protein